MLNETIDQYLVEIKTGRKPKTYAAYDIALRYFFESTKNKPLKQIVQADLIDFLPFLRVDKEQSPGPRTTSLSR